MFLIDIYAYFITIKETRKSTEMGFMTKLIKQDINFLEYPLYSLNGRGKKEDIKVKIDDKKYNLRVGYKTPNSTDMLFLYYFIKRSQEKNFDRKIIMRRSEIIKEVAPSDTAYYYKRLEDTLEIWRNVGLSFQGTFYNGKEYKTIAFGVLDQGELEENGNVLVTFNETFLKILEETNFYRYIDFNELKQLKKPISRRLYELFKKSKFPFKIEIKKLAQKITLDRKYPSDIIIKLNPAIKEINKNTDLNILFSYKKNEFGKTICVFEQLIGELNKVKKPKEQIELIIELPQKIKDIVPAKYQIKSIYNIIKPYCEEPIDIEFIVSNIKYSIINSQKNFPHYLKKSLENDYAAVEREKSQKQEKLKVDQDLMKAKKEREEEEKSNEGERLYNSLSSESLENYNTQAIFELKNSGMAEHFINKFSIRQKVMDILLSKKESKQAGVQEDFL
jgi:hypothetical protein